MLTRKVIFLASLLLASVVAVDIFKINQGIARYSVPCAAFATLLPFPFLIESKYKEGTFQGTIIGSPISSELQKIRKRDNCRLVVKNGFVDARDILPSMIWEKEVVLHCISGGIAWNEILVTSEGIIREIRLSGGVWM